MRDSDQSVDIAGFLKDVGYSQNRLNATKQWLAFSFSGMMKLVKIATTKESWEVYDRFLEDYFQTKAENKVMKDTIENQIEEWKNQKALFMGLAVMERDEVKQMELLKQMENANENITKLEKSLAKEEVVKQLQPRLHFADTITDTDSCYDIGSFANEISKITGNNQEFASTIINVFTQICILKGQKLEGIGCYISQIIKKNKRVAFNNNEQMFRG